MPRYYFHIVSPGNSVRDGRGVELPGLDAALWHAMHLIYRLRAYARDAVEDWIIEISDETGDAARGVAVVGAEAQAPCRLSGSLDRVKAPRSRGSKSGVRVCGA
jgi:hypothetical protein